MVAVPLECGEQEVHVVEEDYSPHIGGVEFRQLPEQKGAEAGARQMLISISELPARQEAHALITYEVVTKAILPPLDTSKLKAPAKPDRHVKPYLSASPFINVNHRKIREAVKAALEAPKGTKDAAAVGGEDASGEDAGGEGVGGEDASGEDAGGEDSGGEAAYEEVGVSGETDSDAGETVSETAELAGVDENATFQTGSPVGEEAVAEAPAGPSDWERVEAIYDYVQDKIAYEAGAQDKSAVDALQDGKADCHGIAALFVAMCRTAKVPARMVWVDEHQYAEFYLEDEAGKGHWYPVQSAGSRAFGEMPTPKVILQKGDNFRVPERRRERLRYASDYTSLLVSPKHQPSVTYVREQL